MTVIKNAWISFAVNETTALQALVLTKCLRRAVTEADIVVLISDDLPSQLRVSLEDSCDVVMAYKKIIEKSMYLSPLDEAKFFSWQLTMYNKCVVLEPSVLVLKNIDNYFDFDEISAFAKIMNSNEFDDSLFVMKPSCKTFQKIMEFLKSGKKPMELEGNMMSLIGKYTGMSLNTISACGYERSFSPVFLQGITLWHPTAIDNSRKPWLVVCKSENSCFPNDYSKTWWTIFESDFLTSIRYNKNNPLDFTQWRTHQPQSLFSTFLENDVVHSHHNCQKNSIAILGHSVRLPSSNSTEEFWQLLKTGGDGITSIPAERLKRNHFRDNRYSKMKAGYLNCTIDEFDASFFGISPREAAFIDPQQRLLLEVAWEALESAGINPEKLKGSNAGVFSGVWAQDYKQTLHENAMGKNFHHAVLGNSFGGTSGRISHFFGFNGPNVATESGCSSSMVALHLACASLRKKETDLALVNGVNLLISPFLQEDISILANDGHCKTFDEKADGFGRGEGVVVVVLKRLSDALRDTDRILGVIRGSALSSEGTSSSFGTPTKYCQEIAIKQALKDSGVKPEDVDYVEAHGTGTPVGDPTEFSAITAAYKAKRENPLIVSSVKTNIGHTESAAGLASLVKVILSMEKEIIPAHKNLTEINCNIDLQTLPAVIPITEIKWSKNPLKKRLAGLSSFGISGTNGHVIIEEAPNVNNIFHVKDMQPNILAISAKSENALKELIMSYSTYFDKTLSSFKDICFTAACGRQHFKHRIAIVAQDINDAKVKLSDTIYNLPVISDDSKDKTVFLFTGASQYTGMEKKLYETSPIFRKAFNSCNAILSNNCGINLEQSIQGKEELGLISLEWLSIFCLEYCLFNLWTSFGLKPNYILGHSLGEYAAAVAAEIMTLEEALCLLSERGRLISNVIPGGMLVLRTDKETVKHLIERYCNQSTDEWLDIAVINSPHEVLVAGKKKTLSKFSIFCSAHKVKTQFLSAKHAFHSRDMDAILERFKPSANAINYKPSKYNYISGTTGKLLKDDEMCGQYWLNHTRCTVNFNEGIKLVQDLGCSIFIEIGPHPILLPSAMTNLPLTTSEKCLWLPSVRRNEDNWLTLLNSVAQLYEAGVNINWEGYALSYISSKTSVPFYPFQRQKYWLEQQKSEMFSKKLHPLLGSRLPLAVAKTYIFQNQLKLDDIPYFRDHQVGNIIILPAAGFLEIILAAGNHIFNQWDKLDNIFVSSFNIEAPLELQENKEYTMQTVGSEIDNNESVLVQIFVFANVNNYNEEKNWKLFSSAKVNRRNEIVCDCKSINLNAKLQLGTPEWSINFDKSFSELGINFGKKFQSISNVWLKDNKVVSKISTSSTANSSAEYIMHPLIIDAVFQTIGLSTIDSNSALHLPIGISHFGMYSKYMSQHDGFYAYTSCTPSDSNICVHLYDEGYNLVATMCDVKLVKTSLSTFLNVVSANKNKLPGLYQNVWRPGNGFNHDRVDFSLLTNQNTVFHQVVEDINPTLPGYDEIKYYYRTTHKLSCEIIKCVFLQAGWKPKLNDHFNTQSFITDLIFSPLHSMLVNRCLSILAEEDILAIETVNKETTWVVVKELLPLQKIKDIVEDTFQKLSKFHETRCVKNASDNLLEVLQGKRTGLNVLFDNPDLSPLILYTDCKLANLAFQRISSFIQYQFEAIIRHGSTLRIIEIGAGSGATTKEVISRLSKKGIPFSYTFTDITPVFLEKAKQNFLNVSEMNYKLLNIEIDPKYQGFTPYSYDIVIAANVIHATESLYESIQNIRQLLVPSGQLILQEMLGPVRLMDILYGMLDSYWRFMDFDIRIDHPCTDFKTWEKLLMTCGFQSAKNISNSDEATAVIIAKASNSHFKYVKNQSIRTLQAKPSVWIIFAGDNEALATQLKINLESVGEIGYPIFDLSYQYSYAGNSAEKIEYSQSSKICILLVELQLKYDVKGILCLPFLDPVAQQDSFCQIVLYIAQHIFDNQQPSTNIIAVTSGVYFIGDQATVQPWQATVWGVIMAIKNEREDISCQILDLDPEERNVLIQGRQIFNEMWKPFSEDFIAIRNNKRYVPKLLPIDTQIPLTLPDGRYKIVLPQNRKIEDLSFEPSNENELKSEEVEVIVKASALNFKDILTITKPEQYFTDFNAIGMDFSGICGKVGKNVTKFKVGDELFGIADVSAVASHVALPVKMLIHKPKAFTFTDAATLPSIFITAYHCLIDIGKLKAEETILIHVASGGVGLIAIQIAKYIGANVLATAGSKRKRAYLKSVGVDHVFNSRNLSFGADIKNITNDNGVDMVLNSLTGVGFKETSLNVCAQNARFIEMGKMNIWQPDEVAQFRPDIKYSIVNLERISRTDMERLINIMTSFVKEEILTPLPYTNFPVAGIKDALNYFLKAQHIGKVVVTMPELKENFGTHFTNDLLFNNNATYLITGGLGGIGLEVTKWMVKCGARCIVLVSRSAPNAFVSQLINSLNDLGYNILSREADIGNRSECEQLFNFIKADLPPLKGVIHSAGIVSDATIKNQTWEKFQSVFNAKVNGSWNLHELTKNLNLEHFVLFSSIASIWGSMAQSNHSAGNACMDSLAFYRHSLGLPAQTINWGAWTDIGAATDSVFAKESMFGLKPLTPMQGIAALKFAFTVPYVQIIAMKMNPEIFVTRFPHYSNYVSEFLFNGNVPYTKDTVRSDGFWKGIQNLDSIEKSNYIKTCVEAIVRQTLNLPKSEKIDQHQKFSEMGLDSLMAVEMRNKLQKMLGKNCTLHPTSLIDYPTMKDLSVFIQDLTNSANSDDQMCSNAVATNVSP